MVENPKLNTSLVSSIRFYPTIDPQFLSYPFTSTNAVKTCSKEAIHSQTSLLQIRMGTGTELTEEPKSSLEDEFQDLHLNLPVLKVLAHAPIYNAMLDKYMESLELGKNRLSIRPRRSIYKDGRPWAIQSTLKDFLDYHLPGEWEITRDTEINPFKDVLVFKRMVEFLGALPINLKRNMWESEDLIENPINWDKPPKDGEGAWHAKIRIIDLDEEEFTKTLQSIPTTRKPSKRESPREIINLDHFYDT
ncbi:hypothetical protein Tco_0205010 [Tanacetum coccineum]